MKNKSTPTPLRLMAIHAHPDDESSKGAATTARYVDEGIEVMVVSCTGGERGDVINEQVQELVDLHGIHQVRQLEMAEAARILGVRHEWLGFMDSGFTQGEPLPEDAFALIPLSISVPPLVKLLREFRPQVVTTYDENGGYPHPDHIQTHVITIAAIAVAADPEAHPELGPGHQVQKVYYNQQFHKERVVALHNLLIEQETESPYEEWLANWEDKPEDADRITTSVECARYFPIRDAALKAHATQIEPDGRWFAVSTQLQQQAWPTEEFQLASSLVETAFPETDLFAGLR
ncbi:MAG: mycothiol conjugate amidase Mca [Candidatus Nanopelagicales bacterium]|nr:mycothiol conjugate amidase Mca [Candidatus Nanopelagicales bacterium]